MKAGLLCKYVGDVESVYRLKDALLYYLHYSVLRYRYEALLIYYFDVLLNQITYN